MSLSGDIVGNLSQKDFINSATDASLEEGLELEVVIANINRKDREIILSLRALEKQEEKSALKDNAAKNKEIEEATAEAQSNLYQLYQSKKVDYLETLTVKDMEILSQVVSMCERATNTIDVIASLLPSELPSNVCKAFSDAPQGAS